MNTVRCVVTQEDLETVILGDEPSLANHLAILVLSGIKRATCSAASGGMLARVGARLILLDGARRHRAIIEITSATRRRFCDIDESIAFEEGEGDLSLSYWRAEHERYFRKMGLFSREMLLNCEGFRVANILPISDSEYHATMLINARD